MKEEWTQVTLGDALELVRNGLNCKQNKDGVGTPISRIETIATGEFDFQRVGYSEIEARDKVKFALKKGDILFSHINSPPHIGKSAVLRSDDDLVHGVNLLLFRPIKAVDPRFMQHALSFLHSSGYWRSRCKQSVNQASVNQKDVRRVPFAYPPLEEQRKIVVGLDEAFEGLSRAKENAEANLQSARELFASVIEAALARAGGEPISLQEMLDTGMIISHLDGNHGSDYPRKAEFVADGVPYISANCIVDNEIDFGRSKYLTQQRADGLRKGVAKNRDVLFAHNATVGPVTLLKTEEKKVILSTSLTYYRCNEDELVPEFLVCAMRSAGFRRQYEAVMAQATRNQVPITMQRKFTHLIPPLAEQRRIAELGVELEAKCNSVVKACEASLQDLEDLRQSLLQKAFAGELT